MANTSNILVGYTKRKKRDRFWLGFHKAKARGRDTMNMLQHAERLLSKKDRAVEMMNRLFEQ